MGLGDGFDAKEQVRQATDIAELVGGYMQLRRQGRNFIGLCPWHDDSRPSLQVNQERQSWKCWVCDIGGDVFSFMMKAEGVEFREALEMLAERAGIDLRRHGRDGSSRGSSTRTDDRRQLLKLMEWAEEQFHGFLRSSPEAAPARDYLGERGIDEETLERFRVGFAPNQWDWLLKRAQDAGWQASLLERVGLLRRRESGSGHYDWFRGRVMFSIRDARSRPIAFGGRVLPELAGEGVAKYFNSPETPLFSKSRELYALNWAREHFRPGDGVVVMEGYTDVLMAHQHGIRNAVAVLGTALGDRHVELLRRYQVDRITLVLDGDVTGRKRTNEILDSLLALFEKNEIDLRILTLPGGADPCDFIATHGRDAFDTLLKQAVDALEHKFRTVTNGLDTLADTHRASQAAEQVLASLVELRPTPAAASSKALLREEQMVARISRHFHIPDEALRTRIAALRRERQQKQSAARHRPDEEEGGPRIVRASDLAAWDRELLELLLSDSEAHSLIRGRFEIAELENSFTRLVFEAICRSIEADGRLEFGRLLSAFDDVRAKNLLVELDEAAAAKYANCPEQVALDRERRVSDLLAGLARRRSQLQHRIDLAQSRQDDNFALEALARVRRERAAEQQKILEQKRK